MKALWNSLKIAFAMFSRIPTPRADWSKENMKYMFCFFPLIGAVIGVLEYLLVLLAGRFSFAPGFLGALMLLVPVLVTGGIHIDGLLDTSDAMSSWQERERRLEILKDSHAGAFALIACSSYFIAFYGACVQLCTSRRATGVFCLVFVLARCLSGFGVLTLPKASAKGTVAEFSRNAEEKPVRIAVVVIAVLSVIGMIYIQPVMGIVTAVCAALVFLFYRHMALKYFGGTSGDLSGFFLCTCETAAALVLAVCTAIL